MFPAKACPLTTDRASRLVSTGIASKRPSNCRGRQRAVLRGGRQPRGLPRRDRARRCARLAVAARERQRCQSVNEMKPGRTRTCNQTVMSAQYLPALSVLIVFFRPDDRRSAPFVHAIWWSTGGWSGGSGSATTWAEECTRTPPKRHPAD
jgi:hypothetical protein